MQSASAACLTAVAVGKVEADRAAARICARRPAPSAPTGKPSAIGGCHRLDALPTRRPGGTGSPASASRALASASSKASPGRHYRPRVQAQRAALQAPRCQRWPMKAAASAASIASAMPCNGTMPRANSCSAVCASGRFSASEATIAPRARVSPQRRLEGVAPPATSRRPSSGRRAESRAPAVEVEAAATTMALKVSRHGRLVVPDERVIVQRIGHCDQRPERRLDLRAMRLGQRRGSGPRGPRRCRPSPTPRRRSSSSTRGLGRPAARRHAAASASRSRPEWSRTRAMPSRLRNAWAAASEPASEAVWEMVAARACAERPTFIATIGFFEFARPESQPFEGGRIVEAFDMQSERRRRVRPRSARAPFPTARSAPGCPPSSGRRSAGRGCCMVRLQAMLEDWVMMADAALPGTQSAPAVLVRPQQRAVGIVDQPVAVRADDRHGARRSDELAPAALRLRHRRRRPRGSRRRSRWRRRRRAAPVPRTTSIVRRRLTPTKAASGAAGRSATDR